MKTRHIIAIGLLSALAVGLLAIGIKTKTGKPKLQVNAETSISQISITNHDIQEVKFEAQDNNSRLSLTLKNQNTDLKITGALIISRINGFTLRQTQQGLINQVINNTQIQDVRDIWTYHTQATVVKNTIPTTTTYINTTITVTMELHDNEETQYTLYTHPTTSFQVANTVVEQTIPAGTMADINVETNITNIQNTAEAQYQAGAGAATDAGNTGVIDIRGLMLQVLTMPFTFISQAFDVVLWENTAYEFHLAAFIKGMIAIAAILFIIRLFTSGFSIIGNYTNNRSQTKLTKSKTKLNNAKAEKIKKE